MVILYRYNRKKSVSKSTDKALSPPDPNVLYETNDKYDNLTVSKGTDSLSNTSVYLVSQSKK